MASAAHVTERTLTGAVGTATGNTGDTRHRAPGTPRLSRGLMTSSLGHGVRLAVVLRHACGLVWGRDCQSVQKVPSSRLTEGRRVHHAMLGRWHQSAGSKGVVSKEYNAREYARIRAACHLTGLDSGTEGWQNNLYVPVWQSLTISGRMGERNTSGSLTEPPPWTDTMGRAAGAILILFTRGRDARGAERGRVPATTALLIAFRVSEIPGALLASMFLFSWANRK